MNKNIEKKLVIYLNQKISFKEFEKIYNFMGKYKYIFTDWVALNGIDNNDKKK